MEHIKLFLGANIVLKILGLISIGLITPFYMRYLGVENYGLLTYIGTWTAILAFLSSFGFVKYIHAYACVEKDLYKRNSIIYSGVISILGLSLCTILGFLLLVYTKILPITLETKFILLIIIGAIVTPLFRLGGLLLLGFSLLKQNYSIKIFMSIVGMIVLVSLVIYQYSLWYFVLWNVLSITISAGVYFYILYTCGMFSFYRFDIGYQLRQALPISTLFAINSGALMLMQFTDRYLIMHILGQYSLGIYASAIFMIYAIFNFIYTPPESYLDGFIKTAVRTKDTKRVYHILNLKVYFLIIILGSVIFSYAIYGRRFLSWYLGAEFAPAHDISFLLACVFLLNLFILAFYDIAVLQDKKANRYQVWINCIAVIINVPLNYILIPIYGILGAVYATVISMLFTALCTGTLMHRKYGFKIINAHVIVYIFIILGVYTTGYMLWDDTYGVIGCFVFSGASLCIAVIISLLIKQPRQYVQVLFKGTKVLT